jgi:Zn-dependent peptidase ImmA (M78 family)
MKSVQCAKQLIEYFDITTAPALHFNEVFKHYNIICREKVFKDPNYMGSLHRTKDLIAILVNTSSKNTGRINFTKAHELGHFCLNHKGETFQCTKSDMSNFAKKPQEIEANQFAREFLLPEDILKPLSIAAPFDFITINAISNQYLVSKMAATIRILDFHLDHYAFVSSMNGTIIYSGLSKSLNGKIALQRLGSAIDGGSFAKSVLNSNKQMNGYSAVDPSVWIAKNHTVSKISLKEYSKANKAVGTVMTLLKVDFL